MTVRSRRLSARTAGRVAIVGALLASAALVVSALLYLQGRRARIRLEREVVQLKNQLAYDRHARVVKLAAIEAERARLAGREVLVAGELAGLKESERTLKEELAEARAKTASGGAEVSGLRARLEATRKQLRSFELDRSRAEQMIAQLQGGVAFVEGSYGFQDASGAPLRFAGLDEKGNPDTDLEGKPLLSAAGSGPVVRLGYSGTAFLVSRGGLLLTNRHIAQPWWHAAAARELESKGFTPRLTSLRATFPALSSPLELRVVALSDEADVAAVAVADPSAVAALPVLPVDPGPAPAAGQSIVLLGYPTGHDALLARLDDEVVKRILEASGGEAARITSELARLGLIRPLATQGHLSDILPGRLVYDAQTTLGGSGGPVLGADGRVIGVNAAILTEFSGASFGVPIRFAAPLLPPPVPGPASPAKGRKSAG